MKDEKWKTNGKIFFCAALLLSSFVVAASFKSNLNQEKSRIWVPLVLLFSFSVYLRSSFKSREILVFLGYIFMIISVICVLTSWILS